MPDLPNSSYSRPADGRLPQTRRRWFWHRVRLRSWAEIRSTLYVMVCVGFVCAATPPGHEWVGILICFGAVFVVEFLAEGSRAAARRAYVVGMVRLAENPEDQGLRREVLALGLRYSAASRNVDG